MTGGAGFVGSHLCERLLSEGRRVLCVDNLSTGTLQNIAHLRTEAGFEHLEGDVTADWTRPASSTRSTTSPRPPARRTSSASRWRSSRPAPRGPDNCLDLALNKGARFMLASTSEVYGDPLVHPQHEDYRGNVNPVGVRGAYDEAKRYAEALTMAYHRSRRVDTRIVRIFNSFGPRIRPDDGRVIPNFVTRALDGRPLIVYGDGRQTRSLQYVDDLIDGILRLMEVPESRPVNIGNPAEMSVREIAETVVELSGRGGEILHGPLPEDDPGRRCPDISRAREVLGWEPRTPTREGLRRTLDWFAAQDVSAKR